MLDRVFRQRLHAKAWYLHCQCQRIHLLGIAQTFAKLQAHQGKVMANEGHLFVNAYKRLIATGERITQRARKAGGCQLGVLEDERAELLRVLKVTCGLRWPSRRCNCASLRASRRSFCWQAASANRVCRLIDSDRKLHAM
ncbi:hypothetical protein [Xanthomonas populi]|uniref:hypothetical protein n=1 Tax=Xanthomonas populi TaxID=53414 RepID=UPI001304AD41|nr:hypothetical protein [Xanthomonas populi]